MVGKEEMKAQGGAYKSTVDLGDEGEALVFRIEQERVRNYKERLVNKVLLLGKTKGLGYDISSIEADEILRNQNLQDILKLSQLRELPCQVLTKIGVTL